MDQETKIVFGKLLGEIYRTQEIVKKGSSGMSEDVVYGLLSGIEAAIDFQLELIGFVENGKLDAVTEIIAPIWEDKKKLEEFGGYYDIEHELARRGVSRLDAIRIFTYLKANHQFTDLIDKMDSSRSPSECRQFEISSLW